MRKPIPVEYTHHEPYVLAMQVDEFLPDIVVIAVPVDKLDDRARLASSFVDRIHRAYDILRDIWDM